MFAATGFVGFIVLVLCQHCCVPAWLEDDEQVHSLVTLKRTWVTSFPKVLGFFLISFVVTKLGRPGILRKLARAPSNELAAKRLVDDVHNRTDVGKKTENDPVNQPNSLAKHRKIQKMKLGDSGTILNSYVSSHFGRKPVDTRDSILHQRTDAILKQTKLKTSSCHLLKSVNILRIHSFDSLFTDDE